MAKVYLHQMLCTSKAQVETAMSINPLETNKYVMNFYLKKVNIISEKYSPEINTRNISNQLSIYIGENNKRNTWTLGIQTARLLTLLMTLREKEDVFMVRGISYWVWVWRWNNFWELIRTCELSGSNANTERVLEFVDGELSAWSTGVSGSNLPRNEGAPIQRKIGIIRSAFLVNLL